MHLPQVRPIDSIVHGGVSALKLINIQCMQIKHLNDFTSNYKARLIDLNLL